jgi:hypothetical protein
MTTNNNVTRAIYSDAYLFDIASGMLDAGKNTTVIHDHLTRVCGASDDKASAIIAAVWGP